MEHLAWYFADTDLAEGLSPAARAVLVCALLYQLDSLFLIVRVLLRRVVGRAPEAQQRGPCLPALLVLPTLLRSRDELEGLVRALGSVTGNGYPGDLVAVACIDDLGRRPDFVAELRRMIADTSFPEGVRCLVTGTAERSGKAMAMEAGVELVREMVERGELESFPPVFFNMDADSTLAPGSLERMVRRLTARRRLAGAPHLIVASNVSVPRAQCWEGLRGLLHMRQWIALLVAREYLTSITLARNNGKLIPVTGVSGALYCTWSQVHLAAPRYAAFMQRLRFRDWLLWWTGAPPPSFERSRVTPRPEAMTGPGDDTWIAWMACTGWWSNGRISFELPRTPAHACARLIIGYFSRPLTYEPLAKVYTKTPVTIGALYRQRLRWNSSRVQDVGRWFGSHAYHWHIGMPVFAGLFVIVGVTASVLASFLLWPFTTQPAGWLPILVVTLFGYHVTRVLGSLTAMAIGASFKEDAVKLLSLPASGPFHFVFNIATTIQGICTDVFGLGLRTNFSPERTLKRSGLTRLALGFRIRRALSLALSSVIRGGVPFGRFWFGWHETPWTPSGFDGWDSGELPPAVRRPVARRADGASSRA